MTQSKKQANLKLIFFKFSQNNLVGKGGGGFGTQLGTREKAKIYLAWPILPRYVKGMN